MRLLLLFLFMSCAVIAPVASFSEDAAGSGAVQITLQECIASAFARNYSIKSSRERLVQSEIDYLNSINEKLSVKLSGASMVRRPEEGGNSFAASTGGGLVYRAPDGTYLSLEAGASAYSSDPGVSCDVGLSFRKPLARGAGRITAWQDVRRAGRAMSEQEHSFFISSQNLAFSVIQGYYRLIYAGKRIEVNELSVSIANDSLEATKKKFAEGLVPKIDLTRAEVNLLNSKASLLSARNSWEENRDSLLVSIGLDPRLDVVFSGDLPYRPESFEESECIRTALAMRRENMINRIDCERLRDNLVIARNAFRPRIDLVATWNAAGPSESSGSGTRPFRSTGWTAGLEYEVDVGKRSLRTDVEKAERELALGDDKISDTDRTIVREVRSALRDLSLAESQVSIREESLVAAEERLRLAKRSWEEGIVNNREMIDAEEALTDARMALVGAKIDYVIFVYALKKAMGLDLAAAAGESAAGGRGEESADENS